MKAILLIQTTLFLGVGYCRFGEVQKDCHLQELLQALSSSILKNLGGASTSYQNYHNYKFVTCKNCLRLN